MKRRTFIQSLIAITAMPAVAHAQDSAPQNDHGTKPQQYLQDLRARLAHAPERAEELDYADTDGYETISGISDGTRCTFDD
ncbi:MAG: hypothetical protein IKY83_06880 [Proteobacteria bacterium]|nr:hypothetical protein [Pseudomonadota bacterium]